MRRIQRALKKENLISIYFTASYPKPESTQEIMIALEQAGADMIEVGIPFSDPLADGKAIQKAHARALQNGFNLQLFFKQIEACRRHVEIPIIIMSYLNPVLQVGMKELVQKMADFSIDGLIVPDLPIEIYQQHYAPFFQRQGVSFIPLITPNSAKSRVALANEVADTFIYLVSSSSTTGQTVKRDDTISTFFEQYRSVLKHPVMIGFGIRNHEDLAYVCRYAKGGIIGSAFIQALEKADKNIATTCNEFIQRLMPQSDQPTG